MKTRKEWMMLFICLIASLNMYAGDKASFLKKQFTASSGYQLNYRIIYPLDYSPEKQNPLQAVVACSGFAYRAMPDYFFTL